MYLEMLWFSSERGKGMEEKKSPCFLDPFTVILLTFTPVFSLSLFYCVHVDIPCVLFVFIYHFWWVKIFTEHPWECYSEKTRISNYQ